MIKNNRQEVMQRKELCDYLLLQLRMIKKVSKRRLQRLWHKIPEISAGMTINSIKV